MWCGADLWKSGLLTHGSEAMSARMAVHEIRDSNSPVPNLAAEQTE